MNTKKTNFLDTMTPEERAKQLELQETSVTTATTPPPAVLANRAEQAFEEWRRSELDQLEADEMYLRDF